MILKTKDYNSNEIFKFIRENSELTQKELAHKANIGKSSIEKYEAGLTSFTYKSFLNVLKVCNLDIILYNDDTKINITEYSPKEVLKLLRSTKDLTQEGLAKLSKVSISNIKKYESGKFNYTFETLLKIVRSFNMDIMISDKSN